MRKAVLCYVIKEANTQHEKILTLEEGSLFYVDKCVNSFSNEKLLLSHPYYAEKIKNFKEQNNNQEGKIEIRYVKDTLFRETLPLIYHQEIPISIRSDLLKERIPEVERARKLLFQSRDQIFTRMILHDETMAPTFDYRIKIQMNEWKKAKEYHIPIIEEDGEYFIHFRDILKCRIAFQKLKGFRSLLEDMLEAWKNNMFELSDEELYYYSRHLRYQIEQYEKNKINGYRPVQHLITRTKNLIHLSYQNQCLISPRHYMINSSKTNLYPYQKRMEEY